MVTERADPEDSMSSGGHLEAMVTASYLDGSLPLPAREALESHLAGCDECRAWMALFRLRDESASESAPAEMLRRARALGTEAEASPRATSPRRLALWGGLAAGVLAAAGLAIWTRGGAGPSARVERLGTEPAIEAIFPARNEPVEAARLAFRWSPVQGADRYVVSVLDAAGAEIASLEAGAAGGQAVWPSDRPLPPPGTYLWSVRALALDRVVAETRPVPFEIR